MLNRDKVEMMWVWNYGDKPEKAYVIDISKDNHPLVVDWNHEVEFEEGEEYYPEWYDQYKKIDESEKQPVKKLKKTWVWNGNGKNPKSYKRYVIDYCHDGCVAVSFEDEDQYLNWETYRTIRWDHSEEIEEIEIQPVKKLKEAWVWNGNGKNPKDCKKYIIDICDSGYIAINLNYKNELMEGNKCETSLWEHYEEIEEENK